MQHRQSRLQLLEEADITLPCSTSCRRIERSSGPASTRPPTGPSRAAQGGDHQRLLRTEAVEERRVAYTEFTRDVRGRHTRARSRKQRRAATTICSSVTSFGLPTATPEAGLTNRQPIVYFFPERKQGTPVRNECSAGESFGSAAGPAACHSSGAALARSTPVSMQPDPSHSLSGKNCPMRLHPEPIRRRSGAAVAAAVLALATVAVAAAADDVPSPKKGDAAKDDRSPKLGLQLNAPKAFQGYTLVAPLNGKSTYLIDMQGRVVRAWRVNIPRARRPTSSRTATSSAPPRSTTASASSAAPAKGGGSKSSTGTATSSGISSSTTTSASPTTTSVGSPTATSC